MLVRDEGTVQSRPLLRGGGGVFGALASPGQPTHPPKSEKFPSGKK